MSDPLSIAASSLAVVGAADVVLRAGVECYHFLSDIQKAPASIEHLKSSFENTTALVETLKKHIQKHIRDSGSSVPSADLVELQPVFKQFNSTIVTLQRDLKPLAVRAAKYSKMSKTWASVRHVLEEKDIHRISERIEQSKFSLSITLSLIEGKQCAIGQKKIENAIHQSSQQTTSALQPLLHTQKKIELQNTKVLAHVVQQEQVAKGSRRDLQHFQHVNRKEHESTRRQMARGTDLVLKKLEDYRVSSAYRSNQPRSNRKIFLRGADRESALSTLLLMKGSLSQAVVHVITHHRQAISQQHLSHITSEFNRLLSSALQENAAQHPDSTATSLDTWYYPEPSGRALMAALPPSPFAHEDDNEAPELRLTSRRKRDAVKVIVHETAIGRLVFRLPKVYTRNTKDRGIVESQITFIPNTHAHSTIATARFFRLKDTRLDSKLCTQLNMFRKVENWDLHCDLYGRGSVKDIDVAIREGRINPYDTSDGIIISHFFAGCAMRADVMQYLDSQGVGSSALNGHGDILLGLWYSLIYDHDPYNEHLNSQHEMQSYLDGYIDSFQASDGMDIFGGPYNSVENFNTERMGVWRDFLVRNRGEEGFRDDIAMALRTYCWSQIEDSSSAIRVFLDWGADPNATDERGFNAIHYAMGDIEKRVQDGDLFEEKLLILIEAGGAIHHGDKWGLTPSVYARLRNRREHWCRALKRAGLNIEEVLQVEMNEWLQEDGWSDRMLDIGFPRDWLGIDSDEEIYEDTEESETDEETEDREIEEETNDETDG